MISWRFRLSGIAPSLLLFSASMAGFLGSWATEAQQTNANMSVRRLLGGIFACHTALLPFSAAPATRSLVQVTVERPRCVPGVSLGLRFP